MAKNTNVDETIATENTGTPEVPATGTVQVKSVAEAVKLYVTKHNDATPDQVETFLKQFGVNPAKATIRSQVAAARKELGLTKPKEKGPVDEIKTIFEAGYQTVAEVVEQLKEANIEAAEATVKTQVGKLRKEAGLGRKSFEINLD